MSISSTGFAARRNRIRKAGRYIAQAQKKVEKQEKSEEAGVKSVEVGSLVVEGTGFAERS